MLILYEPLWLNICKNIPFQGTNVETKVVGDIYMLADDDCKNHHVATLQLPHIADLSPQCLVPTCPAYIQAQEFRIFKADFKASITQCSPINQDIMHSSTKNHHAQHNARSPHQPSNSKPFQFPIVGPNANVEF